MTNMIQTQQQETNMVMMQKQQGVVTILGSNCDDTNTPSSEYSSLRRTLSADMSSQKWLSHQQNMKKIPSSEQLMQHSSKTIADSLSSASSSEDEAEAEAERERLEIWSSIQRNKKEEQEKAGAGAFDMWSSLVSLKDNNEISKSLPVSPYIHPLVKRSKSLSEKSLEICTESLGSETGSDGLFSSYPSSETEEDKEEEKQQEQHQQEEPKVIEEEEPKYNNYGAAAATKKYSPSSRSFPPPLPSLGPSLHMRTHRDNGRLVLEAVSVPSNNNFCVQRQDGRLVLTFANQEEQTKDAAAADDEVSENDDDEGVAVEELEEDFGDFEEFNDEKSEVEEADEDETEEVEDVKDVENAVIEKAPLMSSEITTTTTNGVHRLTLMMNKSIGLVNRNPNKWSEKFNEVDVNVVEVETSPVAKSLPPRPRVARLIPSTNFNAYEYYWKTKPTTAQGATATTTLSDSLPHYEKHNNNNSTTSKVIFSGDFKQISNDQRQQLMVVREKNGDYKLIHNLDQSCKDSRRSFLFFEPYCIATS